MLPITGKISQMEVKKISQKIVLYLGVNELTKKLKSIMKKYIYPLSFMELLTVIDKYR